MSKLVAWLRRKLHRCSVPEFDGFQVWEWVCPECGGTWRLEQWHEEDRADMWGADADIGHDVVGWVRQ